MGLRAIFAAALPQLFDAAGEDAIFSPAAGTPIPCKIFIEFNVQLQPSGADSQVTESATIIEALKSVILNIPVRGDTFLCDGITYTVMALLEDDGLSCKVVVI